MGEVLLIVGLVIIGFLYVRGARRTQGGSPGEWADWAGDEARNLGTKTRDAWRNRYDDEINDEED
jgi:hypothetical protein